jgi:hypothetical protein
MIYLLLYFDVNREGGGGLLQICKPMYFIRVTIYPVAIPHKINRGHYILSKI